MKLQRITMEYGRKGHTKKFTITRDDRELQFDSNGLPIPFDPPKYHCMICNKKIFRLPILYVKEGKYVFSGEAAFHYFDTHGIPPELLDSALGITEHLKLLPRKVDAINKEAAPRRL